MASNIPVTLDTPITIKILFQGHYKKFKIPLKELGVQVLPDKLRGLLLLQPSDKVVFERWSDSAGVYVTLDPNNPQVYKTLFRAAKAKLKLKMKATLVENKQTPAPAPTQAKPEPPLTWHQASTHPSSFSSPPPPMHPTSDPFPPARATDPSPPLWTACPAFVQTAQPSAPLAAAEPAAESRSSGEHEPLAFRPREVYQPAWVVFCNNCNEAIENEHSHCSICDGGDYDLCSTCVAAGFHCPGSRHWMLKRFLKNGIVVNGTTERIPPKTKPAAEKEMPGAFTEDQKAVDPAPEKPTRTCNCCVGVFAETEFVTCTTCDDYDLCLKCHLSNKHGHHPGHAFQQATPETVLGPLEAFLCNAGRNVRHWAVCDGCEKFIYGVRHKCVHCPDWDFCSECIKSAKILHPRHRFVPIYEPLAEPTTNSVRHYGIYCDGPLCRDKDNVSYIEGVRYKCAVCHDTDFCANCEANPSNRHNRTHPLIKFKTPVRNVSVTTMGEDQHGASMTPMGDQPARKSAATETTPVAPSTNAATQVQTVVDLKPREAPAKPKDKIDIKDLLAEPAQEKMGVSAPEPKAVEPVTSEAVAIPKPERNTSNGLDAHFVRDTISDGTKITTGSNFVQVWTVRNPGPNAWPAGCSVRYVGGDNMLNLDNSRPFSQSELAEASESNVLGKPVEAGEEVAFRVLMKAPKREGTAISYWRVKTAEGLPFGHRLWCDIQVIPQPAPVVQAPASQSSSPPSAHSFFNQRSPTFDHQYSQFLSARTARRHALEQLLEASRAHAAAYEAKKTTMGEKSETPAVPAARSEDPETKAPAEPVAVKLPVSVTEPAQEPQPQDSGMIFPRLEKESPASSTHEANVAPPPAPLSEADIMSPSEADTTELFEDAESVDIIDGSSDDEAFMTDEEYDVLNASDEEMP